MTTGTVTSKDTSTPCYLHCKEIRAAVDLPALNRVFASRRSPSILGGNVSKADADGVSYWAAEPREIFEFHAGQEDPFRRLHKALTKYKLQDGHENVLPKGILHGGWIGYFGYELGRYIETLPATTTDDLKMPLIRLCFYDRIIAYDHKSGTCWLIALDLPRDAEDPREKLAGLERLLAESRRVRVEAPAGTELDNIDLSAIQCNMSKDYYVQAVGKIKRYIYDGDIYQANFSQRFECDYRGTGIELFHWQNHYNPSPYAAYIDSADFQIVSASPEMFITISDRLIRTKPIKGTRPRLNESGGASLGASHVNAKNFNELLTSEKEQAELNMIIDLERNDVARVCVPGTRTVVQPRTIEGYPTVFHAVATVAGRLRREITFCDVLKAMFPGGSITGAPKIRSMEVIDETEPTARGVYTGSIGFISVDGSVCLNIAIRTIIITGQKAFAQTGGGIVADSDAQAEWDETITKARALIAGIRATQGHSNEYGKFRL
jgi:para-aminobenzoate synthetase component 1